MWRKYARAYPVAIIQSTQTYTNVLVHRWIGDSFICIDLQQLEAINCGQNIAHCQNTETYKIDENLIMNNFYEMIWTGSRANSVREFACCLKTHSWICSVPPQTADSVVHMVYAQNNNIRVLDANATVHNCKNAKYFLFFRLILGIF